MSHSESAIAGLYDHEQEVALDDERHAPDWGGDELFASTPRRRRFDRGSHVSDRTDRPRLRETTEHPVPTGRRTVTVTGRPGAVALRPQRPFDAPPRRAARTLDERIGARPDRVAALAFGLGLLLIAIAIATAHG